jgi:hypothetical protein
MTRQRGGSPGAALCARLAFAIAAPWCVAACATLAGTSAQSVPAPKPAQAADHVSGMASVPPCPDGLVATLDTGVQVHFDGAAPLDPQSCVQTWSAREHEYILGIWRKRRLRPETDAQRAAIAQILTAPVGTAVRFDLRHDTRRTFFDSATIQHVGNEVLTVGREPRHTLKLELVLHDAQGRPESKAESLLWIDRKTGIPLKKEVVTRTADGGVWNTTVWRVQDLGQDPTG